MWRSPATATAMMASEMQIGVNGAALRQASTASAASSSARVASPVVGGSLQLRTAAILGQDERKANATAIRAEPVTIAGWAPPAASASVSSPNSRSTKRSAVERAARRPYGSDAVGPELELEPGAVSEAELASWLVPGFGLPAAKTSRTAWTNAEA